MFVMHEIDARIFLFRLDHTQILYDIDLEFYLAHRCREIDVIEVLVYLVTLYVILIICQVFRWT